MAAKDTVRLPPSIVVARLQKLDGQEVTARRLGWDESLPPEEQFDLEPYGGDDGDHYPSDDLEGVLSVKSVPARAGVPEMFVCLVGGQEADPLSIKEKRDEAEDQPSV